MLDDEGPLIRRAKQGDREAFSEIYRRHYDAIYAYLSYRLGDAVAAEDLTSEVFVRLVEKIPNFTYRGRPILAWLYTIARNLLTDYHRQSGSEVYVPLDEQWVAATPNPARTVERRLERECLARALRHLSDSYQQVILLRFIQSLSHAETAAILGKTENATKVLQHRALKALRRALAREGCYEP